MWYWHSLPYGYDLYQPCTDNLAITDLFASGAKSPMWCTATGKLYLSQLPISNRRKMLQSLPLSKFTKNTIVDIDTLNAELDHIAKTGIGIDNEEFISEMVAVAVPILDKSHAIWHRCICMPRRYGCL